MAVQPAVVKALKTSLEKLVVQDKLKAVYVERVSLSQAAEYPYVFFELGTDEEYASSTKLNVGGGFFKARSEIHIGICMGADDEYAAKDLADLIHEIRKRIVADRGTFVDGASTITITGLRQNDPRVSQLFNEFATATITLSYTGRDSYP